MNVSARPNIPKLPLNTQHFRRNSPILVTENDNLMTSHRSDYELHLPTSFRHTDSSDDIKLSDQMDRLNGLLENVMQSISKETLISPKAVNIDDDINHYNQKSSIAEFSFFSIEPEISNVQVERLMMQIEDLQNQQWRKFKFSHDPIVFYQDFEKVLHEYKIFAQENMPLDIYNTLEQLHSTWKFAPNVLDKDLSQILDYSQIFNDIDQTKNQSIMQDEIQELKDKLQESFIQEQIGILSLQKLKNDLENLTGQTLPSIQDHPELELPVFCKQIIRIVGETISKEKEIERNQKALNKINLDSKLQVACTPQDIHDIYHRLEQIGIDIEEMGCPQDYVLQVGLLQIQINVDYADEAESRRYTLPVQIATSMITNSSYQAPSYEMPQVSQEKNTMEQSRQESNFQFDDASEYIRYLEEMIDDLQLKLKNQQEVEELAFLYGGDASQAGDERILELEGQVDDLSLQIEMLQRQNRLLQGVDNLDGTFYYDYREKMVTLKDREDNLKLEFQQLELQRQKLARKNIEMSQEKQIMQEKVDNAEKVIEEIRRERLDCKDVETQVVLKQRELGVQIIQKSAEAQTQVKLNKNTIGVQSQTPSLEKQVSLDCSFIQQKDVQQVEVQYDVIDFQNKYILWKNGADFILQNVNQVNVEPRIVKLRSQKSRIFNLKPIQQYICQLVVQKQKANFIKPRLWNTRKNQDSQTQIVLIDQQLQTDILQNQLDNCPTYKNIQMSDYKQKNQDIDQIVFTQQSEDMPLSISNTPGQRKQIHDNNEINNLQIQLDKAYKQLKDSNCKENTPHNILQQIQYLKSRIDTLKTQQALQITEKSLRYIEKKFSIIESDLDKSSRRSQKSPIGSYCSHYDTYKVHEDVRSCSQSRLEDKVLDILNDRRQFDNQELHNLLNKLIDIKHDDSMRLEQERYQFDIQREKFQQELVIFNRKKEVLRSKINRVNERQRKLMDRERQLAEKQTMILIEQKKSNFHKQAIDEEWSRVDQKKQDFEKFQKIIEDEWQKLKNAKSEFNALKSRNVY